MIMFFLCFFFHTCRFFDMYSELIYILTYPYNDICRNSEMLTREAILAIVINLSPATNLLLSVESNLGRVVTI